jgi:CRISPR-associated protein Cmr4
MNTKLMTIFTRTPLHVGCGSSVGAVDQPVARERHTRFPIIPGTAIKGVLADLWLDWSDKEKPVRDEEGVKLFGAEIGNASAGSLLIGEGRILLFPVRSAKKCWAWITCPLALERFAFDAGIELPKLPEIANDETMASSELALNGSAVFEDYPFVCKEGVDKVVSVLKKFMDDTEVLSDNLAGHLAVVTDELFAYFVSNACEIANHNRIDDVTGVVENRALFSQENVPSETLFYSVLGNNGKLADVFDTVSSKLNKVDGLLQIGANATTGLGWCSIALKEKRGVE